MVKEINKLLETTLEDLGLTTKLKEYRALDLWSQITGKEIQLHTKPRYINQGTLFVSVDNSTWAHQLLFMKQRLIKQLNEELGKEIIKDIRFKVGHITTTKEETKGEQIPLEKISLSQKKKDKLEDIADRIDDEALQTKFFKFLVTEQKIKKWQTVNNWATCSTCKVMIPPNQKKCTICKQKEETAAQNKLKDLLVETPWLDYEEAKKRFPPLSKENFKLTKQEIITELKTEIKELIPEVIEAKTDQQRLKVLIQKFAMLKTEVHPQELTTKLIREVVDENWGQIYKNL